MSWRGFDASATPKQLRSPHLSTTSHAIEIAARHALEPLPQGKLDNLCGLYSTINALRLALAEVVPLSSSRVRQLFEHSVELLDRKGWLADALVEGMSLPRRLSLARCLARHVSGDGFEVTVEPPGRSSWDSIGAAFRWIDDSLAAGMPVLAWIYGVDDHYTVIAGTTDTRLHLFDSNGLRFIQKSSCALVGGRHQIPANGLLRIAVHQTP